MAAIMPYQPVDDIVSAWPKLVSTELFTKIAENINYMIASVPVGTIMPILYGFTGVPLPDPTLWQLCDGSMVTDQKSPLRNSATPDYTTLGGLYMKAAASVGTVGNIAGSHTVDLRHSHGGVTGNWADTANEGDREGADRFEVNEHHHGIFEDLFVVDVQPNHFTVLHYIKIN